MMALEPADDAALELVGLGSHGSAVACIRWLPERDIGSAAYAGGKDFLRVVRGNVIVGEPVDEEHGRVAHRNSLSGVVLDKIDAVSPARIENAGFHNGTQKSASEPRAGTEPLADADIRACLRSSEQQPEEGQVDHLQAGIEFSFAVLP